MSENLALTNTYAADADHASTWSSPPSWMRLPPTAEGISPHVRTRPQLLPVDRLAWEDFERLCLRLLEIDMEVVHLEEVDNAGNSTASNVGLYGHTGQAQHGIDVYARDQLVLGEPPKPRRYVSLQARRTKTVRGSRLRKSVETFLGGRWSEVSRKFVYATSASTKSNHLVNEIEKIVTQLVEQFIEFEVWDKESISRRLKDHPEIVDEFFGRQWVNLYCGRAAASGLNTRLDAHQVATLRGDLLRIYTASFGINDSGLMAFRFSEAHPAGLRERFVTPDLVSTTLQAASQPQPMDTQLSPRMDEPDLQAFAAEMSNRSTLMRDEGAWFLHNVERRQRRTEKPGVVECLSADQWIGREPLQAIVGDPGAGKSTLLRFLILDLLSDEPVWRDVAKRWGQRLPVWLPFHFFTQRVAGQTGAPASVGSAIKAWLEQHGEGQAWPLVESALDDRRLLLVIDGLDEWVDAEAGRSAVSILQTFAASRSIPVIVSSRPFGLERLALGTGWKYRRIAPLTMEQQRSLAFHYFHAVADTNDQPPSFEVIDSSVDSFLAQVYETPDLRSISGNPLFLTLLVGLRLSKSASLPTERFGVYEEAVKLLVASHPANRRAAAAVTAPRQNLSDRQLRNVLARIAFVNQLRGDVSTFHETTLREDFIDALRDPDHLALNAGDAVATAEQLLDIVEGELGLLIRKGPTELGFLHRMLQEQLVAEYMSERVDIDELYKLFAEHLGDPRWREVILATMWRVSRASELKGLSDVIRNRIDESPVGLRAREILAEVVFGPYGLPGAEIRRAANDIIEAIETHPYGPHRARLLNSLISGMEGAVAGDIVQECLERWALLLQEPSRELVWEIAQIPSQGVLSDTICRLLVMALHSPHSWIAYVGAIAIAGRCSKDGPGSDEERELLRAELFDILSNPPSAIAQASALIALALEWRDDPSVGLILQEARAHAEDIVRIVALSDALGVLRSTFSDSSPHKPEDVPNLTEAEREYLLGHLYASQYSDMHSRLLLATLSEMMREDNEAREKLVEELRSVKPPYSPFERVVRVALDVLADDRRVVDFICEQLIKEEHPVVLTLMSIGDEHLLSRAYPPSSPHNTQVSKAIEDRLRTFATKAMDRRMLGLAAVDRGPIMKQTLMENLTTSSFPHWAAAALSTYFGDDDEVLASLRAVLVGDSVRASMIANAANTALATNEIVPRLMKILRDLARHPDAGKGRPDIVASALIQTFRERGNSLGPETEALVSEVLQLMPTTPAPLRKDLRYDLAEAFYPSAASKKALAELSKVEGHPLEPFLRVFRHDVEHVRPFLAEAAKILRSLPVHLRAFVCQSLAERNTAPHIVLSATRRWADEVSEHNKSIASLAYHHALFNGRTHGYVDNEEWDQALVHLRNHASCYGQDHEARRRGAWVGICVLGDWSILEGLVETMGGESPLGVRLSDPFYGADITLLQQLALRWEELRSKFGGALLTRISGNRGEEQSNDVWNALAVVAAQNVALQRELESEVISDPELLKLNDVLVWFVTRRNGSVDVLCDAIISHLQNADEQRSNLVSVLIEEPERLGLQLEKLGERLEFALQRRPAQVGNPVLQALAMLLPEHFAVQNAWQEFTEIIALRRRPSDAPIHLQTYLAVAFARADSREVARHVDRELSRLARIRQMDYDDSFLRHAFRRLRRDSDAVRMIRNTVLDPATPDFRAACLASLLSDAVGLDQDILHEVERRIAAQCEIILAPVVWDPTVSAALSVRTILTRVVDASLDTQ